LFRQGDTGSVRVMNENTGFAFPEKTTTFLCPQSDAMIGWKRTKPSYEEGYKVDAPMKMFGTAINDEFGDVEETGILIAVDEIREEKRRRHIETFSGRG
jgi:hypothetical protein